MEVGDHALTGEGQQKTEPGQRKWLVLGQVVWMSPWGEVGVSANTQEGSGCEAMNRWF